MTGWIIVMGTIVCSFVWLHEKIEWLGIGIIGAIIIGFSIFGNISKNQKNRKHMMILPYM